MNAPMPNAQCSQLNERRHALSLAGRANAING
jgi:hypothetical protein